MSEKFSVTLKELPEQQILSIRKTMALTDFDAVYGELFGKAKEGSYEVIGAPIAIYHDSEFNPEANDTELAVPVATATDATRVLEGGTYAMTSCKESFESLPKYYAQLVTWIAENGYTIAGIPFEQYTSESPDTPNTDIYFKIAK